MVCANCDHVGVRIELVQNAPASTPVLCAMCKFPRGTLGDLRALSEMDRVAVDG
jgi:hypothetical protein